MQDRAHQTQFLKVDFKYQKNGIFYGKTLQKD